MRLVKDKVTRAREAYNEKVARLLNSRPDLHPWGYMEEFKDNKSFLEYMESTLSGLSWEMLLPEAQFRDVFEESEDLTRQREELMPHIKTNCEFLLHMLDNYSLVDHKGMVDSVKDSFNNDFQTNYKSTKEFLETLINLPKI